SWNGNRASLQGLASIFVSRSRVIWSSAFRRPRKRGTPNSHNDRPVSIAHARATWQQRVFIRDIGVRVNGDRGNMQIAPLRPLIQRLNIFQLMVEPITTEID